MADPFDPYHAWLGIPPEEQPPSCYRLLGLAVFESDPQVIEHAADQRMIYLKSFSGGRHAADAQRMLNYVAAARLRLLDPYKKDMYDRRLREDMAKQSAAAPPVVVPPPGPQPPGPPGREVTHIGLGGKQKPTAPPRHAVRTPPSGPPQEPTPLAATPLAEADEAMPGASPPRVGGSDTARGLADAPTATFTAIGQFGEYQLLEKLGEGGMGAVYKAMHTRLRRVVALKLLPRERLRDEHALARFDREMAAVGAVDHVNVVRAMDAREVEGTRFLVMEYVEGLDLNVLGKQCHPLAVADVCEIVRQAALGLNDIHRHGLVHRDIKPSNLMVTPQGIVKLLDLGLARFQADDQPQDEVTGTGTAMGTVDDMAPEQIGDARTVDIRADIYSLGCTLYKLLSGRTPFSGDRYRTAGEKMAAHLRDAPPPITQHCPGLPAALSALVMRMLSKDPAKRPARPADVADAVGPLATTANLAALVRAALGPSGEDALTPTADPQAALETHSSSTMTRFFRDLVGASFVGARAAGGTTSAASEPSRRSSRMWTVATAAVVAVLVGGVGLTYYLTRPGMPQLVLEIPESERAGLVARIDDVYRPLPEDGPIELAYPPGEHEVYLQRPGFAAPPQKVRLVPGQRLAIRPTWRRQPNVTIPWPAADRQFGRLEVNGVAQDLDAASIGAPPGAVRLTLAPGKHQLLLERLNHVPVAMTIDVVEGQPQKLDVTWREGLLASATKPDSPPPAAAANPEPAKPEPAKPEPAKAEPAKPDSGKPEAANSDAMAKTDAAKSEPATTDVAKTDPAKPDASKPDAAPATPELSKSDPSKPTAAKPEATAANSAKQAAAKLDAARVEARRRAAAEWTKQTAASEAKAAAWDFAGAKAALANAAFLDAELSDRLRQRRDALDRMAVLKTQLIARINAAQPRPKKSDLGIRGLGGEVTAASEEGLTSRLYTGKDEVRPWNDLGDRSLPKLLQYAIDDQRADDWVAGGLAALTHGDAALAERLFAKAKSLGTDIAPYVAPLAEAALARAEAMVEQRKYPEAESALSALDAAAKKHDLAAWQKAHAPLIDSVRAAAARGVNNAAAEKVYAEAASLFAKKELFDAKPLVDELKSKYADTAAATDAARKPSFAEMNKAVANLGKRLTVRQDGKGDYKTIQAALDAAGPNSLVEIRDSGPYHEQLRIDKEGVTLRGKKGLYPVIASAGLPNMVSVFIGAAPRTNLERLVIAHNQAGAIGTTFSGDKAQSIRSCIFFGAGHPAAAFGDKSVLENCLLPSIAFLNPGSLAKDCMFLDGFTFGPSLSAETTLHNVLLVGGAALTCNAGSTIRSSTLTGSVKVDQPNVRVIDSILQSVQSSQIDAVVEHCNVHGSPPFVDLAKAGKGCIRGDPQFADPANLDYSLGPTSPCRGKASNGGDVGFHYTPELVELVKVALELRRRGVIKF